MPNYTKPSIVVFRRPLQSAAYSVEFPILIDTGYGRRISAMDCFAHLANWAQQQNIAIGELTVYLLKKA